MMYREARVLTEEKIFNVIAYTFLSILTIFCTVPFIMVLSGSITREKSILRDGYRLIPKEISFDAYKLVFTSPGEILNAYAVTIFITSAGTILSLFLISMTAYVLQRKEFKYRNAFAFYFYFTTLFSGGLVPWYILMVRYLKLKDNILSLIVPMLFSVFYMIIIRTFMSNIPDSINESAKIDGAGEFRIFVQLIMPLSKPVLATMGLFIALNYWNDWFHAMLFIENKALMPLQYFLYRILSVVEVLKLMTSNLPAGLVVDTPGESLKMAMTVVTIGPIIFLYPYLQKYFIRGIMIGAVKG